MALASEEAAHAVMAALVGIEIGEAPIDSPAHEDPDIRGLVATVPNLDRLFEHLLAVLAGPLVVGREIPWKPDVAAGGDEGVARGLWPSLDLTRRIFRERSASQRNCWRCRHQGAPFALWAQRYSNMERSPDHRWLLLSQRPTPAFNGGHG